MRLILVLAGLAGVLAEDVCFDPIQTTTGEMVSLCVDAAAIAGDAVSVITTASPDTSGDINSMWILICGILVFLMQSGFMLVEAGSVSSANVQNIIFKNLMDAAIGALSFWVFGYGIAYGSDAGRFVGTSNFFLADFSNGTGDWVFWFFQFVFAATASTIVSGAVAERCHLVGYFTYAAFLTVWVYPVVVHWVWADGWLSAFVDSDMLFAGGNGLIDFAGSGVVHMVGGVAALVGSWKLGPRRGRFNDDGEPMPLKGNSPVLVALGVFILWFGWYGFNPGSTLAAAGGAADLAGKVAVVTTLSACAAAVTVLLFTYFTTHKFDVLRSLNGILAGLVSITAPCSVVDPIHAVLIGIIGAGVYEASSRLLIKLNIDDPVDAVPIHGFCGAWGVISVAIFATAENMQYAGYAGVTGGPLFLTQIIGVVVIALWTGVQSFILFSALDHFAVLRVSPVTEIIGLDMAEHGFEDKVSSEKDIDRKLLAHIRYLTAANVSKKDMTRARASSVDLASLPEPMTEKERGRINAIFAMINTDNTGAISRREFCAAVMNMGLQSLKITPADLDDIFLGKDQIDRAAFEQVMMPEISDNDSLSGLSENANLLPMEVDSTDTKTSIPASV